MDSSTLACPYFDSSLLQLMDAWAFGHWTSPLCVCVWAWLKFNFQEIPFPVQASGLHLRFQDFSVNATINYTRIILFRLGYSCMFAQSANVCCTAAHSKLLLLSRPCMKRSWQLQRALTQGLRLLLHFFSRRPDERLDSMRVDEETTMGVRRGIKNLLRNKSSYRQLHCLKIRHQSIRLFVLASQRPLSSLCPSHKFVVVNCAIVVCVNLSKDLTNLSHGDVFVDPGKNTLKLWHRDPAKW